MDAQAWRVRLRALAALEVELDQFVAEQVGAAKHAGLSWDEIAQAVGVSRPSAWRRWKAAVDDPRPTRPLRRDTQRLSLEPGDREVVDALCSTLAERVTSQPKRYPWARAVRAALDQLRLAFDVVQRDARETEYRVRHVRLQVTCLDALPSSSGGLSAVVYPRPELSLDERAKPRTAQLRADEAMIAGEILVERVIEFIREQINAELEVPPGD